MIPVLVRMLKILHIITGLGDGGAEAVLFRLITHDDANEHFVLSLTDDGKYGSMLRSRGIKVNSLNMPRGRVTLIGFAKLWRELRTVKPDVVQTWMYHADLLGGLISLTANVATVWGVHNTTLEGGGTARATKVVAQLCAKISAWLPSRIIACSQAAADAHVLLGYCPSKWSVIHNGFDLAMFRPIPIARQRLRREWRVPDSMPLFGMVARYDPYKDHATFFEALSLLVDRGEQFRVVLIGSGMTYVNEAVSQLVKSNGLIDRVLLLGPRHDIPEIMNAIDIHVLSSFAESFGNVIAEAMACGTPCVTTDVGSPIVGGTGWVVPSRNSKSLADAMQLALQGLRDPGNWQARQIQCRVRIRRNFSIDRMVHLYRVTWEEAHRDKKK